MRLSIIVPFLNSHEIVRRQILWFRKMELPDDVEILFMDDGSDPPLSMNGVHVPNMRIIPTNDFRPWTSSIARNTGAKLAKGAYFLMTDGDYIVPKAAILQAREFTGDKMRFRREFGVLDEDGHFTQNHSVLMAWGLPIQRIREKGTKMPPHPNNFCMRREVFFMMGGYDEKLILSRPYPQGEDRHFKRDWARLVEKGKVTEDDADTRPTIYMFPNGQYCGGDGDVDYNPFGLFHTLTRKTPENHWHTHKRYDYNAQEVRHG